MEEGEIMLFHIHTTAEHAPPPCVYMALGVWTTTTDVMRLYFGLFLLTGWDVPKHSIKRVKKMENIS